MSDDIDLDHWMRAMSAVLQIPLDDADPDEIKRNLAVARRMAAQLLSVPLDDREEALPVFKP